MISLEALGLQTITSAAPHEIDFQSLRLPCVKTLYIKSGFSHMYDLPSRAKKNKSWYSYNLSSTFWSRYFYIQLYATTCSLWFFFWAIILCVIGWEGICYGNFPMTCRQYLQEEYREGTESMTVLSCKTTWVICSGKVWQIFCKETRICFWKL